VASLLAYIAVYIAVFGAGGYYLVRLVQRGFASDTPLVLLDKRSERAVSGVSGASALILDPQSSQAEGPVAECGALHQGVGAFLRGRAKATD
jgi:hypothetical protein